VGHVWVYKYTGVDTAATASGTLFPPKRKCHFIKF